jgi:hypothetical protein
MQASIEWGKVVNTQIYLDYFGPTDPTYITASQKANIANDILTDLRICNWKQINTNEGAADDNDLSSYIEELTQPHPST